MGALHEGHLSLIREARKMADKVIVSIFVNPVQFGPHEDYMQYPRDLARDADLAATVGIDYIFAPTVEDIYPPGFSTYVNAESLSEKLCGKSRPGHFRGVATVVSILLNVVRPHFAFFGQKDAQQTVVIKRVVRDLKIDVEIVVNPTVRESDGLALSSRNAYLTPQEREIAPTIFKALQKVKSMVQSGVRDASELLTAMGETLAKEPQIRIDYTAIVDGETLDAVSEIGKRPSIVAIAAYIGKTRLIDNIILSALE
jgi:pantoate--beta-alanine ligase